MAAELANEYQILEDKKEDLIRESETRIETLAKGERAGMTIEAEHHRDFPFWIKRESTLQEDEDLEGMIKLKSADPSLTREILKVTYETKSKEQRLHSFKSQINSLFYYASIDPDLADFLIKDSEQVKEQNVRVRKLVRETLVRLCAHTDKHISNHNLDEKGHQALDKYSKEIIEIYSNMHFTPLDFQINEIQILKLQAIKSRVHKILEQNGITDSLDIGERTTKEKIEHIKVEIRAYEVFIEEIDAKIYCLLNNERLNLFKAHLSLTDEQKQALNQQIEREIVSLQARQDQLRAELDSLFSNDNSGHTDLNDNTDSEA